MKKYHGFPYNFSVNATSDIIFIPSEAVPQILPVLDHIIGHGDLFCEIATPLAVNEASHDFVKMEDGYLWADIGLAGIERMSKTAPFVHPVKLAIAEQAMLWVCFILYTTIVEFKAIYIYRGFQQKKIANYPIVVKNLCFPLY